MCVVPTYPESTPIFKENKKITDYAKGYKNEYLFIRGIDKCFEFFYVNFEDFINERIPRGKVDYINGRLNEILDKFERQQQIYKFKTKDKFLDLNDGMLFMKKWKTLFKELMKKCFYD